MHLLANAPDARPATAGARALGDVSAGPVRCATGIRRTSGGACCVVRHVSRRIVPAVLERAAQRSWTSRG